MRLYKLADVADRLGCHVETLRIRIRSGRLKAVRGPHGAYYISAQSRGGLLVRKRPIVRVGAPAIQDVEAAWRRVKTRLNRMPRAEDEVVPFLRALEADPGLHRAVYRLVVAIGLQELGYSVVDIASAVGVSERQTRRLIAKDPYRPVARVAHRWWVREARRLVGESRAQLQAEGIRFHEWTMRGYRWAGPPTRPDRPRPAFKVKALLRDERLVLRHAGLSLAQIRAIETIGLAADELNQLLLKGSFA
jgi:AraC-like DNA-binding protein